jgi:hypothetical protein
VIVTADSGLIRARVWPRPNGVRVVIEYTTAQGQGRPMLIGDATFTDQPFHVVLDRVHDQLRGH